MGDPPIMELAMSYTSFLEVLIILPTNTGHCLLETGELILQVFKGVHQNVQLSRFLAHLLPQLIGLENGT